MTTKQLILFLLFAFGFSSSLLADTVDTYQIYIEDVLVYEGIPDDEISKFNIIKLDSMNFDKNIIIKFNHCALDDEPNKRILLMSIDGNEIYEWKFSREESYELTELSIREIWEIKNIKSNETCLLRYYDDQLPEGLYVATIKFINKPQNKNGVSLWIWVSGVIVVLILALIIRGKKGTNR